MDAVANPKYVGVLLGILGHYIKELDITWNPFDLPKCAMMGC
jgi:hypothetical protein